MDVQDIIDKFGTNITALKCDDKNHPEQVQLLNELCTYANSIIDQTACFPANFTNPPAYRASMKMFASIWLIFTITAGVLGNLLTLVAIPMAIFRKK